MKNIKKSHCSEPETERLGSSQPWKPRRLVAGFHQQRSGFTIIAAIFIIIIVVLLAITTATMMSTESSLAVKNTHSTKAFYIADAGFDYYLKELKANADWSTPPTQPTKSFSGGVFTISTSAASQNSITVTSLGIITSEGQTYTRTMRSTITRMAGLQGILNEYLLYWGGVGGGGSTTISNNVGIWGDIFANSSISMGNGTTVNGDTLATGTITGGTVTGSREQNTSLPTNPPTMDTTYYTNLIAYANSNPTPPPGNKTWNTSTKTGSIYIRGNLVINGTISVTGVCTTAVTGTITINNGAIIRDNMRLISGGLITINNNVTIGKRCLLYSTTGFSINNNFTCGGAGTGEGTSLITPGAFSSFWNNATIYGFIYVGGTLNLNNGTNFWGNIIANQVSGVGNNSQLHLSSTTNTLGSITGLTGGGSVETSVTGWDEIYN
jgi:hypothetical protein